MSDDDGEDNMSDQWVEACATDDIEEEDLITFAHDGHLYALYRTEDDRFYATDGHCTHEHFSLEGGYLMGNIIECPMHNGRFDITTGKAQGAPVCEHLNIYETRVENGRLSIKVT
jgi:3-phenylpropionate/trans-cinnamate dioxygenase ferredoxin subunit